MTAPTACRSAPSGGRVALMGRAKLRAEMTTAADTPGCCCDEGCSPPPLTDIEAQQALRHVSNADALAFARGEVALVSFYGCESCDAWVPTFAETTVPSH